MAVPLQTVGYPTFRETESPLLRRGERLARVTSVVFGPAADDDLSRVTWVDLATCAGTMSGVRLIPWAA